MRLKNVDVGEGSLSPEQITEFIDQMQAAAEFCADLACEFRRHFLIVCNKENNVPLL